MAIIQTMCAFKNPPPGINFNFDLGKQFKKKHFFIRHCQNHFGPPFPFFTSEELFNRPCVACTINLKKSILIPNHRFVLNRKELVRQFKKKKII